MKTYKKRIIGLITVIAIIITVLSQDILGTNLRIAQASSMQSLSSFDDKSAVSDTIAAQVQSGEKVYEEESISLPQKGKNEFIMNMLTNPDGLCEVFTCNTNDEQTSILGIYRYTLVNGDWKVSSIKWNDTFGATTTKVPDNIQYSPNGNLYCIVADIIDYYPQMSLAKISDDGSVDIIDIPALSTKTNNNYPYVSSYAITKNDLFIFTNSFSSSIYSYDLNTGKMLYSIDTDGVSKILAGSNTFTYLDLMEGSLITIDATTGDEVEECLLVADRDASNLWEQLFKTNLISNGNDIYSVSKKGIYRYHDCKYTCLVDDYANKINLSNITLRNSAISKDGSFYILTWGTNYSLYHYVLKDAKDIKYSDTFNIAVYEHNDRVSEATALFAKTHPDIKVSYIKMSEYDSLQSQKYNLGRADVVISGSQNYSMIKSTGLLKDLSDTAQSLVKEQGLYKNVIDSVYEKNKLYTLPIAFTPYIFAGDKTLLASTKSIASLIKYSSKSGKALWQGMNYQALGYTTFELLYPMLTNEDGSWNKKGVTDFFNSIKKTCSIDNKSYWSSENDWFNDSCYSNYLEHKDSLLATEIDEAPDLMSLLYVINQTGGSYKCSGGFEVNGFVSINKYAMVALTDDFLNILYGKEAQSASIKQGIPLKINSLDDWMNQYPRNIYDSNGNLLTTGTLLKSDDISNFTKMFTGLSRYVKYSELQVSDFAMNIQMYLNGIGSVNDAVNRIVN